MQGHFKSLEQGNTQGFITCLLSFKSRFSSSPIIVCLSETIFAAGVVCMKPVLHVSTGWLESSYEWYGVEGVEEWVSGGMAITSLRQDGQTDGHRDGRTHRRTDGLGISMAYLLRESLGIPRGTLCTFASSVRRL